ERARGSGAPGQRVPTALRPAAFHPRLIWKRARNDPRPSLAFWPGSGGAGHRATARTTAMAIAGLARGPAMLVAMRLPTRRLRLGRRSPGGAADDLDRLFRHLLDGAQLAHLGRRAKRHGAAVLAGTRGAADAVDIGVGHVREVVVVDMAHVGDVDPA